jgi:hypothetical protein
VCKCFRLSTSFVCTWYLLSFLLGWGDISLWFSFAFPRWLAMVNIFRILLAIFLLFEQFCLDGGLTNILPRLAWNCDPTNLRLPSSQDYICEPATPDFLDLVFHYVSISPTSALIFIISFLLLILGLIILVFLVPWDVALGLRSFYFFYMGTDCCRFCSQCCFCCIPRVLVSCVSIFIYLKTFLISFLISSLIHLLFKGNPQTYTVWEVHWGLHNSWQ